ncbi:MAG: DDE-type integrase/transposase/recombinase [Candidatus Vogelbacteria bacterium]|nr:DDE-type integrase/transposase/recombinase [Candidatus Vogelbacteria bacterium]
MAYTTNPKMPKVRRDAVRLVRYRGWSIRKVARYLGFEASTISRWCKKDPTGGWHEIPTGSSQPNKSPRALPREIVTEIIKERIGRRRCAEHVHHALKSRGVVVSLSSVKRTLDRCHLLKKRSLWKRPHDATPRPEAAYAVALLEIDTIHILLPDSSRMYIYTIIDLYSRWAYAKVVNRIGAEPSVRFIRRAIKASPFLFKMVQSDNGSEFSIWFTHGLRTMNVVHRHSRVRQSNDNAHIERFNRTIQEECLDRTPHTVLKFRKAISEYLSYYNSERSHMGINYQTPLQVLRRC